MPFHVSYGVACGERTVAACCEIKTGLGRGSLVNFGGLRGTRNAVAPPFGTLDSEARISGPKTNLGPGARCRARGPRFWAGNWAQNPVLKIRPSGGPAGWDKVCAPGVIRAPCQAKERVTVGIVSHAQARLFLCVVLCPSQIVRSLGKRAPFSSPNGATEAMTPPF